MIRLTIRQMQYFEALAQTLHFGRAAELAGVTQPALSAQIAEMEAQLGFRLFERGGGTVQPTDEAHMLQPRIARILAEVRDVESLARKERQTLEGRFRLGIIPTVAPYLLPHLLPRLTEQFPALKIELREAVTSTLIDETVNGRLDGVIVASPVEEPALASETLFADRFLLVVPATDEEFIPAPVLPESLALERLMLLEEGHCLRDQALAICSKVKPLVMASYGATSLTTLLQMVEHRLGVTLIPEIAVGSARALANLKIVPFADPQPSRVLSLAWRKSSSRRRDYAMLAATAREAHQAVLHSDATAHGA